MGPRHHRRGNMPNPSTLTGEPRGLQWGHGIIAVETYPLETNRRLGFNGATASSPWKRAKAFFYWAWGDQLQWGHGIIAVETAVTRGLPASP